VDHARAASLLFNKRRYSKYKGMLAWACVDYLMVRDTWPDSGDHAAGWETSHIMALHPELVDLSRLPPKGEKLTGIMVSGMLPHDSTAEFGQRTLEASRDAVLAEVRHRLEHQDLYRQHGGSLQEGLWKTPRG
jgi:creatinine amidohydrolase